jgi:hypothetical protein
MAILKIVESDPDPDQNIAAVLWIRIHMFLGLPDPDPSINMQK